MKCHYDILQVAFDASDDDIRKAYRKLALKWHPDKNLSNSEEAKEHFQLVQQAYDILSDPQERSWYDRHRDSILKGGLGSHYQDDSLNVYQYFTTTCFKGYGDEDNSFYSVYGEVFNKIAAEDSEFDNNIESDIEIPIFGNSQSSYEEVVHLFYGYWQSYSTKKSYSWLDEYDIRYAPNRRVLRLMEKENKKIRDKARKERSEEVRALVAFVRKRDKRVQEYAIHLEKKANENEKKMEDLRQKQLKKRREEMSAYVECDWAKFSNLEGELKEIEANLAVEFEDMQSEGNDNDSEEEFNNTLHCLACNKVFKTDKALLNHEKSKKHKENIEILETILKKDDDLMNCMEKASSKLDTLENSIVEEGWKNDPPEIATVSSRKKKKKKIYTTLDSCSGNTSDSDHQAQIYASDNGSGDEGNWEINKIKNKTSSKKKKKLIKNEDIEVEKKNSQSKKQDEIKCAVCCNIFSTKNELFKHLRLSGHSVPKSEKENPQTNKSLKKRKCK